MSKINSMAVRLRSQQWRYDPRWWTADPDEIEVDRPIFLLGTQGGGLTLVSRILRRNPSVVSVTGDYRTWNGPDEMQNVLAPVLPASLQLRGRKELFRHGGWTYATDRLINHFREEATDVSAKEEEQMISAIKRVIAIYGNDMRTCRFIDKSQSYTVKVSYINEILNESSPFFVLITRDPYISCYRAALKTNLSKLDLDFEESIRWAAQHWTNSMRHALKDGSCIDKFCVIKIEDIIRNLEEKIYNICSFVDIRYEEKMLPSEGDIMPLTGIWDKKWYPVKEDINKKYESYIGKKEVEIINGVGKELIGELDYKVR